MGSYRALCRQTLFIKAGEQLSLQYHEQKDETIFVQEGEMLFIVDTLDGQGMRELTMRAGDAFHVTPGTIHRMRAVTDVLVLRPVRPRWRTSFVSKTATARSVSLWVCAALLMGAASELSEALEQATFGACRGRRFRLRG